MDNDSLQRAQIEDLPQWLWLWLPAGYTLLCYVISAYSHDFYQWLFTGEHGMNELLTLVILAVVIVFTCRVLIGLRRLASPWLSGWVWLFLAGCIYFAGEEASWGQHFFLWGTPEPWHQLNDQRETNLHNLDTLGFMFDQLPRLLLTLALVVCSLVAAGLHLSHRRLDITTSLYWFLPTVVIIPTTLLVLGIRGPGWLYSTFVSDDGRLNITPGEFKEMLLAFALLLYICSIHKRLSWFPAHRTSYAPHEQT